MRREWKDLTTEEKALVINEFSDSIKQETDKMVADINQTFVLQKLPIRMEVETHLFVEDQKG